MGPFYPIVIVQIAGLDGGGFLGHVPDLPDCNARGDTPALALANALEAVAEWLDHATSSGLGAPAPGSAAARARQQRDTLVELVDQQNQALELARAQNDSLAAMVRQQAESLDLLVREIQLLEHSLAAINAKIDETKTRLNAESPYALLMATS